MRFLDDNLLRPNEVFLKLKTPLTIQIQTDDCEYVSKMMDRFTKMVPGFQFMPQYRSGFWNGRVCMIDKFTLTFPYGILFDYIRIHKKEFPRNILKIDNKIKDLFKLSKEIEYYYDLKFEPRPYQLDCIEASLKHTKGIIRSATASGKSLVITYVIWNLIKNNLSNKAIIIVPSTSLIKQFHDDMVEYGIPDNWIGEVFAKKKEWDNRITISTWQSLTRNKDRLSKYDCVIVDEVHHSKSKSLKDILGLCKNAFFRLGFTGTMPPDELDSWSTKAYLGPIIREYSAGELASDGWISKCTVNFLSLEYLNEDWGGLYTDVKQQIFENEFRLNVIKDMVNELNHNVLLLVGKVEDEGELLKKFLTEKNVQKEVIFLSGKDNVDVREKWRKECIKRRNISLIATYGIFQQGINIPNLKYIILASPFKSKIRVLQSIGRSLRKHSDKENGAQIFDIHDDVKYLGEYGVIRLRYYSSEKFTVNEFLFREDTDNNIKSVISSI
jgi:superfamily II DNA or RNA helicase